MPGKILVGSASWTDPGFIADWYPRTVPASGRLRYYAEHFNFVELNSSFYAVPARPTVERWCTETPPGFTFDVKLHRLLSRHATDVKCLPPELREMAKVNRGKVQLTPDLEREVTGKFLREIQPFRDAGKLGALLLQLTPGFAPPTHALPELDPLLELLSEYRVAVELRNRRWVNETQREPTIEYFKRRGITFVGVDAPEGEHFMAMPDADFVTTSELAYVRLHGRNLRGYISGKTVAERFDYLYSDSELEEVAKRAARLAEKAAETHIVFNNNRSDYALRNAATFQKMIGAKGPSGKATERKRANNLEFDF